MAKRYVVRLTAEERDQFTTLVKTGKGATKRRLHAQILLLADTGGPAMIGWSRERRCRRPPPQIRTGGITAYGSYLGALP